jgi:hypothetical protein
VGYYLLIVLIPVSMLISPFVYIVIDMMPAGCMMVTVATSIVINAMLGLLGWEMCRLINAYHAMNTLMIPAPLLIITLLVPSDNAWRVTLSVPIRQEITLIPALAVI